MDCEHLQALNKGLMNGEDKQLIWPKPETCVCGAFYKAL